jgi:hypothetical protein
MTDARLVIDRLRRDLAMSGVLRAVLLTAAAACLLLQAAGLPGASGATLLLLAILGTWMVLSYRSARGSKLAAISPQLIASGDLVQAEQSIQEALRSFSLFRSVKLRSLHYLAVLRHAQGRWGETVLLCQELLQHRLGSLAGITRSTRLMLADSLLELGDVRGAHAPLDSLYRERLSLGEALELTAIQLEYLWRLGRWDLMTDRVKHRLELIELMPPLRCARAQWLLAAAAEKAALPQLATWLKLRVEAVGHETDGSSVRQTIG